MRKSKNLLLSTIAAMSIVSALSVQASEGMYEITVTNVTRGQTLTPILAVSHKKGQPLFSLGEPASSELATVAESGNTGPLMDKLIASGMAFDSASSGGLLDPGASVTLSVKMKDDYKYVSVVSMLIPTNDAFFAVNGIKGPKEKKMMTVMSPVYDAGSEENDELCANIPGPACGGEGSSDADGEGFVHVHAGIHGIGDLAAYEYDWRNPGVKISIKRVKK